MTAGQFLRGPGIAARSFLFPHMALFANLKPIILTVKFLGQPSANER